MNIKVVASTFTISVMIALGVFTQSAFAQNQKMEDVLTWAGFRPATAADAGKFTLDQAKELVIGKWKINLDETKKVNKNNDRFTEFIKSDESSKMLAIAVEFTKPEGLTRYMGDGEPPKSDDRRNPEEWVKYDAGHFVFRLEGQEPESLEYKLTEAEENGEKLPENQFFVADPVTRRHGTIQVLGENQMIYTAISGIPFSLVLDRK